MAAVKYIENPEYSRTAQRTQLDLLQRLNANRPDQRADDAQLNARIQSFELAFRMQTEMPRVQDFSSETAATLEMYGLNNPVTENFGRQCLMARRFAEAGVRFIQITHSDNNVQWDQHSDLFAGHTKNAAEVDLPIAALIQDLKQRGLLEDTLLMWGGEFGRTPVAQGTMVVTITRMDSPCGCRRGVRGGLRYGATDEYGYYAIENKMHIHDVHATMLHSLGLES